MVRTSPLLAVGELLTLCSLNHHGFGSDSTLNNVFQAGLFVSGKETLRAQIG